MKPGHLALICAALALAAAAASRLGFPRRTAPIASPAPILGRLLPAAVDGWKSAELPLGPTEGDRSHVRRLLEFDDYVYREYSSPGRRFAVYAAYWRPGKVSPTMAGIHTPDICWVADGWTCVEARAPWPVPVGGADFWPAHYRIFRGPGGLQHVVYWHLVGGVPFYGDPALDGSRSFLAYFEANLLHLAGRDAEQYLVRLSSDRPFEQLADDPGFREVMDAIGRLGLFRSGQKLR